MSRMMKISLIFLLGGFLAALAGASETIRIADGSHHAGSLETRNSPILIGNEVIVDGTIHARNGSIRAGDDGRFQTVSSRNGSIELGLRTRASHVESRNGGIDIGDYSELGRIETRNGHTAIGSGSVVSGRMETRNGAIRIGAESRVGGSIAARNGAVRVGPGGHVAGAIETRNGNIELTGAEAGQDVLSRTGDVVLRQASQVGGNISIDVAEIKSGWRPFGSPVQYPDAGDIRILDGSILHGDLIIRLPDNYNGKAPSVTVDASSSVRGRLLVDSRVELNLAGQTGPVERL